MKHIKFFEEIVYGHNIDVILNAYLETALWTEEDRLQGYNIYDFDDDIRNDIKKQIIWFVDLAKDSLNELSDTVIGHDLWLSRNGHGSGFFDRSLEKEDLDLINMLCKKLGEMYLDEDDDDRLYVSSSDKYLNFDINKFKEKQKIKKEYGKYNL